MNEAPVRDEIVYLQRRTCDAMEATLAAFREARDAVRGHVGGGIPLSLLRRVERAVIDLDRELHVDLERARVTALDADEVAELRWMATRDVTEVAELQRLAFDDAGLVNEQFLRHALIDFDTLCIVAEVAGRLAAAAVLQLFRGEVIVANLCVHPDFRRRGIGRQLLRRAIHKLTRRRCYVLACVHESNVIAQQWLKACGFLCRGVEPQAIVPEGTEGDAYLFEYRLSGKRAKA